MEQAIAFKSFQIPVFTAEGRKWVSVRHTCAALGIDNMSQQVKLKSSPEFTCSDITTTGSDGKQYSMFCIVAEHAHIWVLGISSAKVKPEIRTAFVEYKRECAEVIYNHFMQKGHDLLGITQQLKAMDKKLDHLLGVSETVFGNDYPEIKALIEAGAKKFGMTELQYWGRVRQLCDVSSYKLQNRKIMQFIREDLGYGIKGLANESNSGNSKG